MSDLRDPRVLFAAERTLLAWSRTSIALIGFGFLIERFRLFEHLVRPERAHPQLDTASYLIGLGFIALGALFAGTSALQFRRVFKTLHPAEIPERYSVYHAFALNLALALGGMALIFTLAITQA